MPSWVGLLDRLYFAAAIVALAGVVWWLAGRNDDLGDQLDGAETRIEAIQKSQEITGDVHALDDDALGLELNHRLSRPRPN